MYTAVTKALSLSSKLKGGAEKSYVVAGAILSCSEGDHENVLTMPVSHGVFLKGKAQMNIMDYEPLTNIRPFGQCSCLDNPEVKMATDANGVLTPMPCIPVVTQPWTKGKEDKLIEGQPALLDDSTNTCLYRGKIQIVDDGQE